MRIMTPGQTSSGAAPGVRAPVSGVAAQARKLAADLWRPVRRYGEPVLGAAVLVGMLVTLWAAFIYAPTEAVEGPVQRIFYFHVPMAWIAYLAFFVVFLGSALYLWRRDERWDWLAASAAEVGTIFTTLVLISGSLWGRPIWGTWWVWDARLTSTLILWFMYVGYLLLRYYMGRTASAARTSAVVGIIAFIDVPINYVSVKWWNTLHPQPVVSLGSEPQLPPQMLVALMISMLTFTLLFGFLLLQVYRVQRGQTLAERMRARVEVGSDPE